MIKTSKRKIAIKVVIVGDVSVGKTSLMKNYVNKCFSSNYKPTIGADFATKNVTVDGVDVVMQLWDTAGQEKYNGLGSSYFRGSDCCILVYDVTARNTLRSLVNWRDRFLILCNPPNSESFPFVVVGNKLDLGNHEVSSKHAELWCKDNGLPHHFFVSAKESHNVEEALNEAAQLALENDNLFKGMEDDLDIPLNIDIPKIGSSKSCFCQ